MRLFTRQEVKASKNKEEAILLARISALSEACKKKEKELQKLEQERILAIERIDREITLKLNQLRQS